jgi:putative phosphonate metabolism protein
LAIWRTDCVNPYRIALYYAPETYDPLHQRASAWLGRDAVSGAELSQPAIAGVDIAEVTADARGYGFHATLKPPFRVKGDVRAALQAVQDFAARTAAFALPPLQITDLDGFLALREAEPCPPLQALADSGVTALDPHRAPATEAEIARRKPEKLSPRQREYLAAWGYPYVFAEWRFHMTLTRRLTPAEKAIILPAVTDALGDAPAIARTVTDICIFAQAAPGAPFTILERLKLRG